MSDKSRRFPFRFFPNLRKSARKEWIATHGADGYYVYISVRCVTNVRESLKLSVSVDLNGKVLDRTAAQGVNETHMSASFKNEILNCHIAPPRRRLWRSSVPSNILRFSVCSNGLFPRCLGEVTRDADTELQTNGEWKDCSYPLPDGVFVIVAIKTCMESPDTLYEDYAIMRLVTEECGPALRRPSPHLREDDRESDKTIDISDFDECSSSEFLSHGIEPMNILPSRSNAFVPFRRRVNFSSANPFPST